MSSSSFISINAAAVTKVNMSKTSICTWKKNAQILDQVWCSGHIIRLLHHSIRIMTDQSRGLFIDLTAAEMTEKELKHEIVNLTMMKYPVNILDDEVSDTCQENKKKGDLIMPCEGNLVWIVLSHEENVYYLSDVTGLWCFSEHVLFYSRFTNIEQ